jgi:D-3-phosphoglycerate dehydrogenase / 2-oxoglutarate reductase
MKITINYQEYADVDIEKAVLCALPGVEIVESHTRDTNEFVNEARDSDAAIIQYVRCPKEAIEAMPHMKVIVRYGIAVDTIDVAAARARGIRVCNVPLYCLDEVSNHSLAMILALHRKLFEANRMIREERHRLETLRPVPRLAEATAGLLGFGHISRLLAKKLKPLVGKILVFDPYVGAKEMEIDGVIKSDIESLFSNSDFVSVHVPLKESTRRLVGAELISRMKPAAYLINTSRGPVVDEPALIEALREKKIAGAGLDVFEKEPLPAESPLRSLDNVILTSHYAWYSEGAIKELKETAARQALLVLRGDEPEFEVTAQ